MKKIILTILTILLPLAVLRSQSEEQVSKTEYLEEQDIEEAVSRTDEEAGYNEILEKAEELRNHHLNLNTATREELERLRMFNDFQVFSLLDYRASYGNLASMNELQFIPGFSADMIPLLATRAMVANPPERLPSFREAISNGESQFIQRFQVSYPLAQGYRDSAGYLGGPFRSYFKYAYNWQSMIRAGITAEKDAGEAFPSGKGMKIMDFQSAFIQISSLNVLRTLVVGDFNLRFGQGLTLWSGYAGGKGADVLNIRKRAEGITPSTSTEENRFFRGAAATLNLNESELSFFVSMKRVDANLGRYDSLHGQVETFSSLRTDGLHQRQADLADKDAVGETIAGGHFTLNKNRFRVGLSLVHTRFEGRMAPYRTGYSLYYPTGNSFTSSGIDFEGRWRNLLFFGEGAWSDGGGTAFTSGLLLKADPAFSMAFGARSFGASFLSFYARPFSEGGKPANEQGLYGSFQLTLPQHLVLNGYYDYFRFPWLKYMVDGPSGGEEGFVQLAWDPGRNLKMVLRWKQEQKEGNDNEAAEGIHPLAGTIRNNLRYQALLQMNEQVRLQQRVEFCKRKSAGDVGENGILLSQDISWSPVRIPVRIALRYAVFDAGSYENRIYSYEQDLLYAFSVPAFYGRGTRIYGLLSFRLLKRVEIWIKLARTNYADRRTIGTGLASVSGNIRNDAGFQMRVKF